MENQASPAQIKNHMKHARYYSEMMGKCVSDIHNEVVTLLTKNGIPFIDDSEVLYSDGWTTALNKTHGKYRVAYNQDFTIKASYFLNDETPVFSITLSTMTDRFTVIEFYVGAAYSKITGTVVNFSAQDFDAVNETIRSETHGIGSVIDLEDSPFFYSTSLPIEVLAPIFERLFDYDNHAHATQDKVAI